MINFFRIFILSIIFSSKLLALEVPALTGPVVDSANLLTNDGYQSISKSLMNFYQSEGIQFQVLIIKSLESEPIENYSIKVVDEWKIGKKGDDRAALFLIALEDKKMRIEVGRGLEGTLTDLTSKRIIEEVKPYFKKNQYDNGVALGLLLMARADGKNLSFDGTNIKPRHERKKSNSFFVLLLLFGAIFFMQNFFPNTRGGPRGPRGFGGFGGGPSWGGGGSSGGSSWGGGGGGFSGGGASGDW